MWWNPPNGTRPAQARRADIGNHFRHRGSDFREAPFALVLLIMSAGVTYLGFFPSHWLRGVAVIALGPLVGGVLRLMIPDRQVGLLAVRGRLFDAVCYLGLGVLIVTFALALPR